MKFELDLWSLDKWSRYSMECKFLFVLNPVLGLRVHSQVQLDLTCQRWRTLEIPLRVEPSHLSSVVTVDYSTR